MDLDPRQISRANFPTAVRGYDRTAVEERLRRIADQIEELRHGTRASHSAGKQVANILKAAERTATEIERDAQREAKSIVDQARKEARELKRKAREAAKRKPKPSSKAKAKAKPKPKARAKPKSR